MRLLCVLNAATHSIHVGIFVLPAKGAMKTFAWIATLFATHVIRFDVMMVIVVWDTARPAKNDFAVVCKSVGDAARKFAMHVLSLWGAGNAAWNAATTSVRWLESVLVVRTISTCCYSTVPNVTS